MKRIFIAAALAVLALAASSTAARADQTLRFNIVGAGTVTGDGINCVREAPGAAQTGDCDERGVDGPENCDELFCFPNPAALRFQAANRNGFQFQEWSHPQCGPIGGRPPFVQNPCVVQLALGAANDFTVTATFRDVTAPAATLTSPVNGAAVRGTIPLTATAADNSGTVANVVFRVGGNPFQLPFETPPFATNLDTRTRADGPLAISATATDGVGLANVGTANVTVDNTNPTLAVTGPNNETFGRGATPTWTLNAADATTAVTVRCSVVATGQPANLGACTSNTQERLVNPTDGRYTLTVRATDAAGNFVEQARTFGVDTGPPETTIVSGPDDGSSTQATALTWGFASSEPGTTFECRLYLTAIGPGPFTPCSAAASHSVAALAPGGYTFEVRGTDPFGNLDPTAAKRTVTVVNPTVVHETTVIQQVIVVALTFVFHDANKKTTRISKLVINSVPAGSTVSARCPSGCTKKSLVKKNAKGTVSLKELAKKPLKAKTKITVTVSKPGAVSAVKVLQIQKGKAPTVQSFCQPPGAAKPGKCA